jgi:hypothetical protein
MSANSIVEGLPLRLEVSHKTLQGISRHRFGFAGQMGVDGGRGWRIVPPIVLDAA